MQDRGREPGASGPCLCRPWVPPVARQQGNTPLNMSRTTDSPQIPDDYPHRIRALRDRLALTQARMAGLMGVSFASVNRWENGQTRPSALAWLRLLEAEAGGLAAFGPGATSLAALPEREAAAATDAALDTATDFSAQAEAVRSVVEAERLAQACLRNGKGRVFAVDPLWTSRKSIRPCTRS